MGGGLQAISRSAPVLRHRLPGVEGNPFRPPFPMASLVVTPTGSKRCGANMPCNILKGLFLGTTLAPFIFYTVGAGDPARFSEKITGQYTLDSWLRRHPGTGAPNANTQLFIRNLGHGWPGVSSAILQSRHGVMIPRILHIPPEAPPAPL